MNDCSTTFGSSHPSNNPYFDKPDHNARQIQRIERALDDVALLLADKPGVLPIFERLEQELDAAKRQMDALSRARTRVENGRKLTSSDQEQAE